MVNIYQKENENNVLVDNNLINEKNKLSKINVTDSNNLDSSNTDEQPLELVVKTKPRNFIPKIDPNAKSSCVIS